jgi:hypothetical protein
MGWPRMTSAVGLVPSMGAVSIVPILTLSQHFIGDSVAQPKGDNNAGALCNGGAVTQRSVLRPSVAIAVAK